MKIIDGIKNYEVFEANFECLRLLLNFLGESYSPAYFHGIAGTVFRIGGICPCAPTCTTAVTLQQLIHMLGYDYIELPYKESNSDADVNRMIDAVRTSIDNGVPALVWNAFTPCEWNIVTGYDENEKAFYGRGPWRGRDGEYAKGLWDKAKEEAGLVGMLALIIKDKSGSFNHKEAEIAALKEAVRHANDAENTDKANGDKWVFLQGKAALNRWANDFSNPDKDRGVGDSYCIDIYSSCHARAGEFLRGIATDYPSAKEALLDSAHFFDKEAECLKTLIPYLSWGAPEKDAQRNSIAYPILKEAADNYGKAIDILESALASI